MADELQRLQSRLAQLEVECGICDNWPSYPTFDDWLMGLVLESELQGAELMLCQLWESIDIEVGVDVVEQVRRAAGGAGGVDPGK